MQAQARGAESLGSWRVGLSPSLIQQQASARASEMIADHRHKTNQGCKQLQSRVLSLRSDVNQLKREATSLIQGEGKRMRHDFERVVDTVARSATAIANHDQEKKISDIWRRNSQLTEVNHLTCQCIFLCALHHAVLQDVTMMTTQLTEQRRKREAAEAQAKQLGQAARAAKASIAPLKAVQKESQKQLSEMKADVRQVCDSVLQGIAGLPPPPELADSASQTAQPENCERGSQTATATADAGSQTAGAADVELPAAGDFVSAFSSADGPMIGRLLQVLPQACAGTGEELAYVQLYERAPRDSPASRGPQEYWRHSLNNNRILPRGSLRRIHMRQGFGGLVMTTKNRGDHSSERRDSWTVSSSPVVSLT